MSSHVNQLPTARIPDCTNALKSIYDLVGAHPDDHFYLAKDRAEAINHVLYSFYLDEMTETGHNHFLTATGEDAPIVLTLERLERVGCFGKRCNPEEIERYITPRTGLVTLSWAQLLTGVIHPIEDIAAICQSKGVKLHVDATPILGRVFFRFQDLPIDYLTMDGGVFVKKEHELKPLICGRMDQPQALFDLAKRAKKWMTHLDEVGCEGVRLRDSFERQLVDVIPTVKVMCQDRERLPGVSAVAFPGIHAELLAFHLHHKGIDVTFGGGEHQLLEHILAGSEVADTVLSFYIDKDPRELVETIKTCVEEIS